MYQWQPMGVGSYQRPATDELSWGAIRKHTEEAAARDWQRQTRGLNLNIGGNSSGFFNKIKNALAAPAPSMFSGINFRRPENTIRRPGFIKG